MSEQLDLPKFAVEVESAFLLVGGEKSKAIYDWMIAAQERDRIIKLLEANCACEDEVYCGVRVAIALIKGEQ